MAKPRGESMLPNLLGSVWNFTTYKKLHPFPYIKDFVRIFLQEQNFMPCSSHKWISISYNLNSKGYKRILQNSVFIRKNPGEQMILVPRKLLLLHVCDCNRLRTKIDGLSAQQEPLRLWKSRAWITYFTFWKSTGRNTKQNQHKKSTHSLCNALCLLQPYFPHVYCSAAEYLCLREH